MEFILVNLGLTNQFIPWVSILGLFLFLAGFIIGLGAVTVIDLLGFLGRRSTYWTETTIRAHKVTKPLIWLGTSLSCVGGIIFYSNNSYSPIIVIHTVLAILLILNGCFLSFYVSPILLNKEKNEKEHITTLPTSLQAKIAISFVISFAGWWSSLLLLVVYLLVVI
ncbi:MAG: hypothetical protein ABIO02_04115 [Patescibacteria group bacterium]